MLEAGKQAGTGRWRKLDNKELHNLYSSPYIIKSRMIWVGHVSGKILEGGRLDDLGIVGRILKWILKK
jgi:hypothetical protein